MVQIRINILIIAISLQNIKLCSTIRQSIVTIIRKNIMRLYTFKIIVSLRTKRKTITLREVAINREEILNKFTSFSVFEYNSEDCEILEIRFPL